MAKSREKFLARKLRKKGLSLKEIAIKLKVSKGSASLWCSDIKLTASQVEKLHDKMIKGSYKGRMMGARMQKERKREKIEKYIKGGKQDIAILGKRELFIGGLCLYWGEGSKKSAVRFYNSDPEAVRFIMRWFREILKIKEDRFLVYININQIHKKRLTSVIKFWSEVIGVSTNQFRKPSLIKAKNKKVYENFYNHYGTLCVRIAKSGDLLYKVLGWIKALK